MEWTPTNNGDLNQKVTNNKEITETESLNIKGHK